LHPTPQKGLGGREGINSTKRTMPHGGGGGANQKKTQSIGVSPFWVAILNFFGVLMVVKQIRKCCCVCVVP